MAQQIAGRQQTVQGMDKTGRGAVAVRGDRARHSDEIGTGPDRGQQRRQRRLAFTADHAIDRAFAMLDEGLRDE